MICSDTSIEPLKYIVLGEKMEVKADQNRSPKQRPRTFDTRDVKALKIETKFC